MAAAESVPRGFGVLCKKAGDGKGVCGRREKKNRGRRKLQLESPPEMAPRPSKPRPHTNHVTTKTTPLPRGPPLAGVAELGKRAPGGHALSANRPITDEEGGESARWTNRGGARESNRLVGWGAEGVCRRTKGKTEGRAGSSVE